MTELLGCQNQVFNPRSDTGASGGYQTWAGPPFGMSPMEDVVREA